MSDAELRRADMPLTVRVNPRARRISLRVEPTDGSVILVLPSARARSAGFAFAHRHAEWIHRQLASLPPRVAFADGAVLPLFGRDRRIVHCPRGRGGVWLEPGRICVSGEAAHLPRRLQDWLKGEARRVLLPKVHDAAERLGRRPPKVTIRDTRTRWASCAADGRMSFSWRLLLAPEWVLDYVVAHETAHLVEMNHGPRFWRLVGRLHPEFRAARSWLQCHGAKLHRYG